ncbi:hypothetical protein [Lactobacillus sp. 3B(2020)]|nr:hypothetical protein [Lactobacillus sp. 3B(2020)]
MLPLLIIVFILATAIGWQLLFGHASSENSQATDQGPREQQREF